MSSLLPRNSFFVFRNGYWQLQANRSLTASDWQSGETRYQYRSDELGFRKIDKVATGTDTSEKPAATILIVGDSVSFGLELGQDDNWPAQLQKQLANRGFRATVLNASAPSNGFTEYRAVLEDRVPTLQPQLVVLATVLNDMRLCCSLEMYSPPSFLENSMLFAHFYEQLSYLRARASTPTEASASRDSLRLNPTMGAIAPGTVRLWKAEVHVGVCWLPNSKHAFAELLRENSWHFGLAWSQSAWQHATKELSAAVALSRTAGARVILLSLPIREQLVLGTADTYPQERLAEIADELSITFLDVLPILRQAGEGNEENNSQENNKANELFSDSLHLSAKGSRLVATGVGDLLLGDSFQGDSFRGDIFSGEIRAE